MPASNAHLLMRGTKVEWTWDKFGFRAPFQEPVWTEILGRHLTEAKYGAVRVVGMAGESGHLVIAVATSRGDDTEQITLSPQVAARIRSEAGIQTLRIVRWSEDAKVLIANAVGQETVQGVLLYRQIGRALVLVHADALSAAIGPDGQNCRLNSKLTGWDLIIMTAEQLEMRVNRAVKSFRELEGVTEGLATRLAEQGYLSFADLSVIEPDVLMRIGAITAAEAEAVIEQAERRSEVEQK